MNGTQTKRLHRLVLDVLGKSPTPYQWRKAKKIWKKLYSTTDNLPEIRARLARVMNERIVEQPQPVAPVKLPTMDEWLAPSPEKIAAASLTKAPTKKETRLQSLWQRILRFLHLA